MNYDIDIFRNFFDSSFPSLRRNFSNSNNYFNWSPNVEIDENENSYILNIDVPGVNKKNIKIEVKGKTLKISGHRKSMKSKSSKRTESSESYYGYFEKEFSLPEEVDSEKINANYDLGVLNLKIPKSYKNTVKKIEIN